jgi:ATP-dependent Clp protease ATP-binding subunit ClpB
MEFLGKFATNLNEKAKQNKLDPVIGREDEIRRVAQVLSRRKKNNPVLVGPAGVGKTAIAEGLAMKIVKQEVPESISNKLIYNLDMGQLIAGAKFRGEFEERLQGILKDIENSKEDVVMFIDELHLVVGVGKAEGSIDAGNLLKPALARGEIRIIGATTLDEYRRYIESDKALERRFQPVLVDEPTVEETISILRGVRSSYELHHKVKIRDSAIVAAAKLSDRYITNRFLPDKAIDLIDEAAGKLKLELESLPEELATLEQSIRNLEVEREALKRENDERSKQRLSELEDELKRRKEEFGSKEAAWREEKSAVNRINDLSQKIELMRIQSEQMEREGKFDEVARIRYLEIPQMEKQLEEASRTAVNSQFLKNEITEEEVAEVISRSTGIPVRKLVGDERDRYLNMDQALMSRVIGQDEAIEKVANAIKRSRAGLSDPNRPIGSFLFLGPTGVGKTELSKAISEYLFGSEKNLIRIDSSELSERHDVSKLIGSPPGYVGYEEGGSLTNKVKRNPYSVILFDEIEKAHPEVFNILLQVLDDGRLTDSHGETVNFKNAIVVMTSNIGANLIVDAGVEALKKNLDKTLLQRFKPEFINRIDEIVIFNKINPQTIIKIVDNELGKLADRIAEQEITVEFTDQLKEQIALSGFSEEYGARPVKREIQRLVETPFADKILKGEVSTGESYTLDIDDNKLVVK